MDHVQEVKKSAVTVTVTDKEGNVYDITNSKILGECINTGNIPSIDELLDYYLDMQRDINSGKMPRWWYTLEIKAVEYIIDKIYNLRDRLRDERRKIRKG